MCAFLQKNPTGLPFLSLCLSYLLLLLSSSSDAAPLFSGSPTEILTTNYTFSAPLTLSDGDSYHLSAASAGITVFLQEAPVITLTGQTSLNVTNLHFTGPGALFLLQDEASLHLSGCSFDSVTSLLHAEGNSSAILEGIHFSGGHGEALFQTAGHAQLQLKDSQFQTDRDSTEEGSFVVRAVDFSHLSVSGGSFEGGRTFGYVSDQAFLTFMSFHLQDFDDEHINIVEGLGTVYVENCIFEGNNGEDGVIFVTENAENPRIDVYHSLFLDNEISIIYLAGKAYAYVQNITLRGTEADGLYIDFEDAVLEGDQVYIYEHDDDALKLNENGLLILRNSMIEGVTGDNSGVDLNKGRAIIENTIFSNSDGTFFFFSNFGPYSEGLTSLFLFFFLFFVLFCFAFSASVCIELFCHFLD